MKVRLALALLVLALCGGARADEANACSADSELDYLCGPQKPEDVLALPGTEWLIASGFAEGAGIKLVDTRSRTYQRWYAGKPDQIRWDHEQFPNCSGPVDPGVFDARGLGLRRLGPARWLLLAVNHGGRQSIEAFTVDTSAVEPRLTWIGCQPMPDGQIGNAVASFADGTVLVTVLTRPGTTIGDFMLGRTTGAVWQWRRGGREFQELPGTELPGNNGLEVDPDGKHFYAVAFGLHALFVFDRRDTRRPIETIVAPDFMPDNVHWSGGRLLLAGMRLDEPVCGGLRKVIDGVADPMLCHRGWVVGEVDLARHRIATLASGHPQPRFNGVSGAAVVDGELWLSSFQSDRLAIVTGRPGGG